MIRHLRKLHHRYLSNEESTVFLLLLAAFGVGMYFFSTALMPFVISLVLVFVLLDLCDFFVRRLKMRYRVGHTIPAGSLRRRLWIVGLTMPALKPAPFRASVITH